MNVRTCILLSILPGCLCTSEVIAANDLNIIGLAGVGFNAQDLDKSRAYYSGVLGYHEAFDVRNSAGQIVTAYFKVNDDQYIEITPIQKETEDNRLVRVNFLVSDVRSAHDIVEQRGLNPSAIGKGPEGNQSFHITDPNGARLEFVQYMPGSLEASARGKFLDEQRISMHIYHVGIFVRDREASTAFYRDKLGLDQGRFIPGDRGEFLELSSRGVDLETKDPPIPDSPETHSRYVREQWGAVQHVCLEVPDIHTTSKTLQQRGHYDDKRVAPHIGNNRHWLMNIFDPDGTRTELMEPTLQPAK
jgi:catechol 2,3-dioxygenase-like lactoylglutathione lyase family enzyme